MRWGTVIFLVTLLLAGCTSSKFSCQQTIDGVKCKNLKSVYEEKVLTASSVYQDKVIAPTEKKAKDPKEQDRTATTETEQIVRHLANDESRPIRVPSVILRIWTAPWEDSDGDLHKPGYIYTEVDQKRGRWLFGEQSAVQDTYKATAVPHTLSRDANMESKNARQGTATKKGKEGGGKLKDGGTDNSKTYYGQKPDPNMPKLKLSK